MHDPEPNPGGPPTRLLALVFGIAFVVRGACAACLRDGGDFDVFNYFLVAKSLAAGRGMVEDVVWNYLDRSPAALALPHPSNLYWMPAPVWLGAFGIRVFGGVMSAFHAAEVPFVLLASLPPVLASWLAWRFWGRRGDALWAGLMTVFTPTFACAWVTPDTCALFAFAMQAAFLGAYVGGRGAAWGFALAGAGAGLAHLTRADGALVGVVVVAYAWRSPPRAGRARGVAIAAACYLAPVVPWLVRNYLVAGTPFPGGGLRTAWLRNYEEIFSYFKPPSATRYFVQGAYAVVRDKVVGVAACVSTLLGMHLVVLIPLAAVGWRRVRARPAGELGRVALWYSLLLFVVMALVFPYPARHGTLYHSTAALTPWLSALAPAGVAAFAARYARLRRADAAALTRFFANGIVVGAVIVTAFTYSLVVFGRPARAGVPRNELLDCYAGAASWLNAHDAHGAVIVGQPSGFSLATGRPALMMPDEGFAAFDALADRFGATYALLAVDVADPEQSIASLSKPPPPGWDEVFKTSAERGCPTRLLERKPPRTP